MPSGPALQSKLVVLPVIVDMLSRFSNTATVLHSSVCFLHEILALKDAVNGQTRLSQSEVIHQVYKIFYIRNINAIMNIIHFSDLHYSHLTIKKTKVVTVDPLINTLKKINNENAIDLILFTGDLIDKGGVSFLSTDEAYLKFYEDILNPICTAMGLSESRFIICPGNHDIQREADGDISEKGCLATFNNEDVVTAFIEGIKQGKPKNGVRRIESYKSFEEMVYGPKSENHYLSFFESAFKFKIDGKVIGIIALNSSWRCFSENDQGQLIIGEKQIIDSLSFLADCDYKIAISHHNTDNLVSFDRVLIEKLLMMNFELFLCGHVHSSSNKYIIEPKGKLITLVAPGTLIQNATTDSKQYSNGFSSTLVNFDTGKL